MVIPNKLYDILKWVDIVVLPSLGTAYAGLAQIWGFPYPEEVTGTIMVLCTLIGALLGISSSTYYKTESLEMPADENSISDHGENGEG